jgi:single-strand DNA-binding protein
MNHVNLIGKVCSEPTFHQLPNGRKIAHFSLSTQESYLNANGEVKNKKEWHRVSAWGNWVQVVEQLTSKGMQIAIEGRLISRFYKTQSGERKMVTEVEVNDLIVL